MNESLVKDDVVAEVVLPEPGAPDCAAAVDDATEALGAVGAAHGNDADDEDAANEYAFVNALPCAAVEAEANKSVEAEEAVDAEEACDSVWPTESVAAEAGAAWTDGGTRVMGTTGTTVASVLACAPTVTFEDATETVRFDGAELCTAPVALCPAGEDPLPAPSDANRSASNCVALSPVACDALWFVACAETSCAITVAELLVACAADALLVTDC